MIDYKSPRWRRVREHILKRDGYMCQYSKRFGRMIQADTVHHIFPCSRFPEFEWAEWNLISLDHSVHNSMHYRDSDELTEKGMELLKRTARKNNIPPGVYESK